MTGSDVTCAWCGREVVFGERHGEGACTVEPLLDGIEGENK